MNKFIDFNKIHDFVLNSGDKTILMPNLKNFSRVLDLRRGLNLVCFEIWAGYQMESGFGRFSDAV